MKVEIAGIDVAKLQSHGGYVTDHGRVRCAWSSERCISMILETPVEQLKISRRPNYDIYDVEYIPDAER